MSDQQFSELCFTICFLGMWAAIAFVCYKALKGDK